MAAILSGAPMCWLSHRRLMPNRYLLTTSKDISNKFEIPPKFAVLWYKMYSTDHNEIDQSQRNFAHITTVTLSWCVQNFFVIGSAYFKLEHSKFVSYYEFDRNTISGTGAWHDLLVRGYFHHLPWIWNGVWLNRINSMTPGQCVQLFAYSIFKCIHWMWNREQISGEFEFKFPWSLFPVVQMISGHHWVQVMPWHLRGNKPLSQCVN